MREWKQEKPDDELLYEKELLPVGEFINFRNERDIIPLRVTRPYLDKLLRDFQKFQEVKTRIPLYKTHVEDPDNERGLVEGMVIKPNAEGVDAAFVHVRFADKSARDQGIRNDVSAMCPPLFVDGKGNRFEYALRHVALTSTPVIPGLSKFAPVILSFDTPSGLAPQSAIDTPIGNPAMTEIIQAILDALQIVAPDGLDDTAKLQLVLKKLAGAGDPVATAAAATGAAAPAGAMALSHSPVMVKQFASLREGTIRNMIKDETVTPAHGEKLIKQFCSTAALQADLALSAADENEDSDGETEFDRTIANLVEAAASKPLAKSGRGTAPTKDGKAVVLGHDGSKPNPLIENMKKRAGTKTRA